MSKTYGFNDATITKREEPKAGEDEPGDAGTRERERPKAKPGAAEPEQVIKELEENKSEANKKPILLLVVDADSAICQGLLLGSMNTNQGAAVAKHFKLLRLKVANLQSSPGLVKKYGLKEPQLLFLTGNGTPYARVADASMSTQAFVGYLESMAAKGVKLTAAEDKKLEKERAKAEKARATSKETARKPDE